MQVVSRGVSCDDTVHLSSILVLPGPSQDVAGFYGSTRPRSTRKSDATRSRC